MLIISQTVTSLLLVCIWALMCVRSSQSSHHPPRCEINITRARWEGLLTQSYFLQLSISCVSVCFCLSSCFNCVLFSLVLSCLCIMSFLALSCFVLLLPCSFCKHLMLPQARYMCLGPKKNFNQGPTCERSCNL